MLPCLIIAGFNFLVAVVAYFFLEETRQVKGKAAEEVSQHGQVDSAAEEQPLLNEVQKPSDLKRQPGQWCKCARRSSVLFAPS